MDDGFRSHLVRRALVNADDEGRRIVDGGNVERHRPWGRVQIDAGHPSRDGGSAVVPKLKRKAGIRGPVGVWRGQELELAGGDVRGRNDLARCDWDTTSR